MKLRFRVVGLLFLLPLFSLGQGTELSLVQAIALGLENNYDIRIAYIDQAIAGNNNTWGAAGRLPSIDFSLPGAWSRSQNPGSFLAGRANLNASLNLNWVLFDGFGIQANKARFDLLEQQSAGNAAIIIETNIQAIMLAYNNILVAEAQLQVLDEVLDNSRRRLEYENYRKELGAGSTFELLQFQTAVLTDSTNLVSQFLNVRNARRNLNLLMGVAVDADYILTDRLQEQFDAFDRDELERQMLSDNHNLQNQYLTQRIRTEERRIARAPLYPTVSVSAGTNYTYGNVLLRNRDPDTVEEMPTITNQVSAFDYSAGFSINFNLYNGGNTQRLIQNAVLNEEIAHLQQEDLQRALRSELYVHFDNYRARRQLLSLQNETVAVSQTNLELAEERFQTGLINSFDYRNIQLQYLSANMARLTALRDLKETETELIRLIGGLVKE